MARAQRRKIPILIWAAVLATLIALQLISVLHCLTYAGDLGFVSLDNGCLVIPATSKRTWADWGIYRLEPNGVGLIGFGDKFFGIFAVKKGFREFYVTAIAFPLFVYIFLCSCLLAYRLYQTCRLSSDNVATFQTITWVGFLASYSLCLIEGLQILLIIWPPFIFFSIMIVLDVRRNRRVQEFIDQGLCPTCRYNLTGNTSGVCPECGSVIPTEPNAAANVQSTL